MEKNCAVKWKKWQEKPGQDDDFVKNVAKITRSKSKKLLEKVVTCCEDCTDSSFLYLQCSNSLQSIVPFWGDIVLKSSKAARTCSFHNLLIIITNIYIWYCMIVWTDVFEQTPRVKAITTTWTEQKNFRRRNFNWHPIIHMIRNNSYKILTKVRKMAKDIIFFKRLKLLLQI